MPGVASCHMSPPALGDHLHNVFCNGGLGLDLNRLIIMGIKLRSPRGRELLNLLFFFFSFDIFDEKNLRGLNGIVSGKFSDGSRSVKLSFFNEKKFTRS